MLPQLLLPTWMLPIVPDRAVLIDHGLAIHQGKILDLAPHSVLAQRYPQAERIPLAGQVLLPGLVNLHAHAAMSLLRGAGDDLPLMRWLHERIWPLEKQLVSDAFVYDGSVLAFAEMLLGGTTCCADMYFHPDAVARAAHDIGIRCRVGATLFDTADPHAIHTQLDQASRFHDAWHDHPHIGLMLAPHAPYTISEPNLKLAQTLADQLDCPLTIHLQETRQEVEDARQQHGMTPTQSLERLGFWSERVIAAHGVHLNEEDIRTLSRRGVTIAHCPASNLKLASGFAPVQAMLEAGLRVGIGTDGAASNNRLDMLSELRLAALLAKGQSGNAEAFDAHQALRAATLTGAEALGWGDRIGSLEIGKSADLFAIQLDARHLAPVYDPASHVVYSAGREDVSAVWIAGEQVVNSRQLLKSHTPSTRDALRSKPAIWLQRAKKHLLGTNAYLPR